MPAQSRLPDKRLHVPENAVRGIVVEQVEDFHLIVSRIKGNKVHLAALGEELEAEIEVGQLIDTIEYDYPNFHLSMDCFWAEIKSGQLVLKEAEAAKWLSKEELNSVEWLPADIILINKISSQ